MQVQLIGLLKKIKKHTLEKKKLNVQQKFRTLLIRYMDT